MRGPAAPTVLLMVDRVAPALGRRAVGAVPMLGALTVADAATVCSEDRTLFPAALLRAVPLVPSRLWLRRGADDVVMELVHSATDVEAAAAALLSGMVVVVAGCGRCWCKLATEEECTREDGAAAGALSPSAIRGAWLVTLPVTALLVRLLLLARRR